MKHRVPTFLFIVIILIVIFLAFLISTSTNQIHGAGLKEMVLAFSDKCHYIFHNLYYWIISITSLILLLIIDFLDKIIDRIKFDKLPFSSKKEFLLNKGNYFSKLFSSAVYKQSELEEQDIILDHGFDGIKELDNPVPTWWISLFFIGIAFCFIYIISYKFTDFAHPDIEYLNEMTYLDKRDSDWAKENDIDITKAYNKYEDKSILQQGEEIFKNNCVQCHLEGGKGGIGPNLTDDFWINHKENEDLFLNIYSIVYNGSPNNPQMRAFGKRKELTGIDIEKVASYVYYINQKKPDQKVEDGAAPPQGEFIQKWAQQK